MDSLGAEGEVMEGEETTVRDDADEKEERREGKTVVLGIRIDSKSRELLTWVLVNIAVSGDRVVAVHVRRFSSPTAEGLGKYMQELEPMRKAYEGFCSLRRIDLVIKVCRGFSVRRALVHQVNSYSASHLVLGESKCSTAIRSSLTSIPKYCAKRLPPECSVIAVNNGKIVFGRGALVSGRKEDAQHYKISSFLLDFRKNIGGESLDSLLEIKDQKCNIYDDDRSSPHSGGAVSNESLSCSTSFDLDASSIEDQFIEEKFLLCGTVSGTQCSSKEMVDESPQESKSDALISLNSSVSFTFQEPTDMVGLNWSILCKKIIPHRRTVSIDTSRTSLVQWAKWVSGRPSTSSEDHSFGKHRRSDTFAACNIQREEKISAFLFEDADLRIKIESLQEKYSLSCKLFRYTELLRATCNFSDDRVIGKGGSSLVYKGILPDGKELAIKTLKPSKDSLKQFISEIDVLTTTNHKNIISLLGFCLENNNFVLIYDFLSRGSLEGNLHGSKEQKSALNWYERYRISIGVAEALNYLHGRGDTESVIHMDVKSSNILLSEDFIPKLSDFGLARLSAESVFQISCNNLAGTFGYLAPEYFMFGQISSKTDVYAFGVVLLELLSGRKPINSEGFKGAQSLVMWAKPMLQNGKAEQLVDTSLDGKYDVEQMEWMALTASLCLERDSQSRPTMAAVLNILHGDKDSVKWAKSQLDSSENTANLEDEGLCMIAGIKSVQSLRMLNLEDDSPSESSNEHMTNFMTDAAIVDDSMQGRLSRSSSLN